MRPRTPCSAVAIVRLLHHPAGERRVQRRERQRAIAEDLDQLSAHPEQQHRPELRIRAAADDQLVAVPADHRLDRHALEVLGAGLRGDRVPDRLECLANRLGVPEVEDARRRRRSCG